MDEAGIDNMRRILAWVSATLEDRAAEEGVGEGGVIESEEDLLSARANTTLESVMRACVEDFAASVEDFLEGRGGYDRDVLLCGWAAFSMHGSCSSRQLLGCITGLCWM